MEKSSFKSNKSLFRWFIYVNCSEKWYVDLIFIRRNLFFVFVEVRQDLREYHEEKMKKVQRKLDNLRKTTSG